MKILIITLLLGSLLVGCKDNTTRSSSSDVVRTKPYEVAGLKVDLPGPPVPKSLELPAEIRDYVESTDNFQVDWGTMKIMISHTKFKLPQASLDGAADGAIAQVKANPLATDFTSTKENVIVAGLEGREIRMNLKQDGHAITQSMRVFVDGNHLWQVQIVALGDGNQETLEDLKEAVFGSIKLQ